MPALVRPSAEESRLWLETQVWTLRLLDEGSAEEILGEGDERSADATVLRGGTMILA